MNPLPAIYKLPKGIPQICSSSVGAAESTKQRPETGGRPVVTPCSELDVSAADGTLGSGASLIHSAFCGATNVLDSALNPLAALLVSFTRRICEIVCAFTKLFASFFTAHRSKKHA